MNRAQPQRASVLIVTMILIVVLLAGLAGLLTMAGNESRAATQHYMNTVAFHVAESGVEKAAAAIAKRELGRWSESEEGDEDFSYYRDTTLEMCHMPGAYVVACYPDPADAKRYTVRSVATFTHPNGLVARRAIEAGFVLGSPGGFNWPDSVLVADQWMKLNHSGPEKIHVASYGSTRVMRPKRSDLGYDASVAINAARQHAMEVFNVTVWGTVATGGGDILYQPDHLPVIRGPDSTTDLDRRRIRQDFGYDFPLSERPDVRNDSSWRTTVYGQNERLEPDANGVYYVGGPGEKTYVEAERFEILQGKRLVIQGEVILYSRRGVKMQGSVNLESGATLKVFAASEEMALDGLDGEWNPEQLEIHNLGSAPVNLHGNFCGRINAPRAQVRIHGTQGPRYEDANLFRGQAIGREIEVTNGVHLFYDGDMSNGGSAGAALKLESWKQITPPAELLPLFEADDDRVRELKSSRSAKAAKN